MAMNCALIFFGLFATTVCAPIDEPSTTTEVPTIPFGLGPLSPALGFLNPATWMNVKMPPIELPSLGEFLSVFQKVPTAVVAPNFMVPQPVDSANVVQPLPLGNLFGR
ncbi:unnamed protein product [Caenorhabditis auriculariae]|uniref:Uncharacterized protein n=1 Tax=Caenorhabditis auriculariae TaxID=2777116 RepID=A0A8S1HR09_9PELO|nr:unnamed protein product [Caenorhabditis auriculariae]